MPMMIYADDECSSLDRGHTAENLCLMTAVGFRENHFFGEITVVSGMRCTYHNKQGEAFLYVKVLAAVPQSDRNRNRIDHMASGRGYPRVKRIFEQRSEHS